MMRALILQLAFILSVAWCSQGLAQTQPHSLQTSIQRIQGGTRIGSKVQMRWNRIVLLARPRISSGDTESMAGFLSDTVSKFVLCVLATVDEVPWDAADSMQLDGIQPTAFDGLTGNSDGSAMQSSPVSGSPIRYQLSEVGVGHCVQVGEEWVVVRPDDDGSHGVRLSFLERQILAGNQRQFAEIRTIVRTPTLLMFDVPAIMLVDGSHQDFIMRHLAWLNSRSGELLTLIWLLEVDQSVYSVVSSAPVCWVEPRIVEDRAIHVDQAEFTFGMPGKRAFALERMPPGRAIAWNPAALELAALDRYNQKDLRALLEALHHAHQESMSAQADRLDQ